MFSWKGTLGFAVCAALASATMARGEQPAGPIMSDQLSLTGTPAYLDDAAPPPPPPKPLMFFLDKTPIGDALTKANITIGGFVEGGYTYSMNPPAGGLITGNVFNHKQNRVVLDQADLNITRSVDPTLGKFDIGGTVEGMFGYDAGFIHSNGIQDFYRGPGSPENQLDLVQAFLTVTTPIKGLEIEAGKFVTLLGQEVIDANGNQLYSHTYLFGDAIPFTQTGILGIYTLNDTMTITAGATRGWNQSSKDNNGSADFLGQFAWQMTKATKATVNVSFGPQAAKDNHDYWTVIDLIVAQTVSDQLTITFNGDYGDAPHALTTGSAQWYGGAVYGTLSLNKFVSLTVRGEAYDDQNGFTLGNGNMQVYEGTAGVTVTPMPDDVIGKNFVIRPEVRYDYASKGYYNGGTRDSQTQVAVDAIFTF